MPYPSLPLETLREIAIDLGIYDDRKHLSEANLSNSYFASDEAERVKEWRHALQRAFLTGGHYGVLQEAVSCPFYIRSLRTYPHVGNLHS